MESLVYVGQVLRTTKTVIDICGHSTTNSTNQINSKNEIFTSESTWSLFIHYIA